MRSPHPSAPSVCPNMEASAIARGLFSRPATDQGENWRVGKGGGVERKERPVGEGLSERKMAKK